MSYLTRLLLNAALLAQSSGCTVNFVIDVESASGRDGDITEQATDSEITTPTVDFKADVNGV